MKSTIKGTTIASLVLLTFTLANTNTAWAQLFDLGTLGGATSNAWGIIPDGTVVVGSSLTATAQTQAFSWTGGVMTGLDFLPGGRPTAEARAINRAGLIAGYARDALSVEQAVTWIGTTPTQITNTLGGSGARAFGVSTGGDVTGWARNVSGVQQPFVSVGGTMSPINLAGLPNLNPSHNPALGHNARAQGISPNGRYIVGEYEVDNGVGGIEIHAFVYDRTIPANSYEFSSGGVGSAMATNGINVVGTITSPPDALAASGGVGGGTNFLPQLAGGTGVANAINASGVVGGNQFIVGFGQRATVWSSPSLSATVTDLNDYHATGDILTDTTAVASTLNTYVGNGLFGGQTHGFLLIAAIPEPGTLALMGAVGSVGVLVRRRKNSSRL
jgi:probable HAF family extracellular repeat protein